MRNPFISEPLTINELIMWSNKLYVNPRTGKQIMVGGKTYNTIKKIYDKNKIAIENALMQQNDINYEEKLCMSDNEIKLTNSFDNCDPISLNLFWTMENGIKKIVYPKKDMDNLIFYDDDKGRTKCIEKESLAYMKLYNITYNPVTLEEIPKEIFDNLEITNINKPEKSINDLAFDIFQHFTKISIFIDHELFLGLPREKLSRFFHEFKDIWIQNLTLDQRSMISSEPILNENELTFNTYDLITMQKYLLLELIKITTCEIEEFKFMINYIILGTLGLVIPKIKLQYPDFSFNFA